MNLIFTKHAQQRMVERNIKIENIRDVIDMPEYTIRKNRKVEAYKTINNKTLKVVYFKTSKFIKIITLIWK